jgi:hypothetical protein
MADAGFFCDSTSVALARGGLPKVLLGSRAESRATGWKHLLVLVLLCMHIPA